MANETDLLWTEFGDRLRGFIVRRVRNEADAEDILQEVFLRIHQRVDSIQHTERVGAWLFQVTRNAIVDYYRAPRRRRSMIVASLMLRPRRVRRSSRGGTTSPRKPDTPSNKSHSSERGSRIHDVLAVSRITSGISLKTVHWRADPLWVGITR